MKRKTTITIDDVEFDVTFDYQPEEKAETGPEAQYPGCGAEYEIESIFFEGKDLSELIIEKLIEEEGKSYD